MVVWVGMKNINIPLVHVALQEIVGLSLYRVQRVNYVGCLSSLLVSRRGASFSGITCR